MRNKRDQFKAEDEENEGADIITINNGKKQMNATKKAFDAVYVKRGFTEGDLELHERYAPDERAISGRSGRAEFHSNDDDLTPQQKAAKTRAENKAAIEAAEKEAAEKKAADNNQ